MRESDPRAELEALAGALRARVRRSGGRRIARAKTPAAAPARAPGREAAGASRTVITSVKRAAPAVPPPMSPPAAKRPGGGPNSAVARACASLDELRAAVAACTACVLCQTRTNTVFADGTGSSGVMFVGEGPGENEDLQGVPFVGRAGQLLTDIITKGMGLRRDQVYIANVVKCRPPGNREPAQDEKELCTPFLDRQIELLDPRIVIALGRHSASYLLGTDAPMSRLRGQIHLRGGRKVVATFHPAYLLRSPSSKKECWQDIQLAMREIGLPIPARGQGGTA